VLDRTPPATLDLTPAAPLAPAANHLVSGESCVRTVDVGRLVSPVVIARPAARFRRELRDLRRKQTAEEAIAGLKKGVELYGFTKGQFSMVDLILALLRKTGPARVTLSTWTAARHEIVTIARLVESGELLSMRWLVDFTFARRDPEAANQIRQTFGLESIRVAQNHAKFCLFENRRWRLVLRTSMNLNMNPRFEDFTIAHDPQLATFLTTILDEIWSRQTRTLAQATPADIKRFFADSM
jgi:hypothetical protein